MLKNKSTLFLVLTTVLLSCKQKEVDSSTFIKWVEDPKNGLHLEKEISNVVYKLQYKPEEYVVLKQENVDNMNTTDFQNKQKEYHNLYQFNLRLDSKNKKELLHEYAASNEEYYQKLQYFSFEFQNDIYLVDGMDTLSCSFFEFVPNYGIASFMDFVLAFDKSTPRNLTDKTLIVDDRIFGNGMVKLSINKKDIEQIPTVTL